MAKRVKNSPTLSPKQMVALFRQRKVETMEATQEEVARERKYIDALVDCDDSYEKWEKVVNEFLEDDVDGRFWCLKEPVHGQTIGHIAIERKNEDLWDLLLDIGENNPNLFAKMLIARNNHGKTTEECILQSDSIVFQEMLEDYIGVTVHTK